VLGGQYRLTFVPTNINATETFHWNNSFPGFQTEGVYFPYKNDLQSFKGKINGTWRILVNSLGSENEITGTLNSIRDVKIYFSDDSGDNCCKANAGVIADSTFNACAGDTKLVSLPSPIYQGSTALPDTSVYGYGYVVLRNDTVYDISNNRDLRNLPAGNYKAKGFSYNKNHLTVFKSFIGKKSSADLITILQNPLAKEDTCGALSIGEYAFNLTPASCIRKISWILPKGDSVLFDGKFCKTEGLYKQIIPIPGACDSVTEMKLRFIDPICPKGTFVAGDSIFTKEGTYRVKLSSATGCDSLVFIRLSYYNRELKVKLPEELTCVRNSVFIDATETKSNNFRTVFEWNKLDPSTGAPVLLGNNPLLQATEPGFFQLSITYNEDKKCVDTLIQVKENKGIPQITKGTLLPYTCKVDSVLMGGTLTSEGVEFKYLWSGMMGKLGTKKNEKFAYALSPGTYKFKVTNTGNG
jgi:hypothetical protein